MTWLAKIVTAILVFIVLPATIYDTHANSIRDKFAIDTKSLCLSLMRASNFASQELVLKIRDTASYLLSQHLATNTQQTYDTHDLNLKRPDFEQYNRAIALIKLLETSTAKLNNDKINLADADSAAIKIHVAPYQSAAAEKISKYISDPVMHAYYLRFLDYNYAYFKTLEQINHLLGIEVFPVATANQLPKNEELISQAISLVSNNEIYLKSIMHKYGHDSLDSFREHARTLGSDTEKTLHFVENETVVSIHTQPSIRLWVEHTGIQNQRAIGSSGGDYTSDSSLVDPNDINYRDTSEARLNGIEVGSYVRMSTRLKAKYGEAIPHPAHQYIVPSFNGDQYGSDQWLIKKEVLEKRATWTPDDSLGFGRTGSRQESHDHLFYPWSARSLMTPYADKNLNQEKKLLPSRPVSKIKFIANTWRKVTSRYFEVQIWGPLTLDDVSGFVFSEEPPSEEFYNLLISKNIEVWDARTLPAERYSIK